jgi:hypothetical protein
MATGDSKGDSKGSGFTVTDRRSFADRQASEPAAKGPAAPPDSIDEGHDPAAQGVSDSSALPAVDFHTFVLSLGSSALLHLGELEHPDAGGPRKDLPLAKHTIDILVMLEEKTRGNLTPPEEKLITSLLYDLRLRYVELSKAQPK